MTWLLFALFAAAILSIVNIIDKFVVSSLLKKPVVQMIFFGFLSLVIALVVFAFKGFPHEFSKYIWLAVLSGIVYGAMVLFYYMAVMSDEVSAVIPLFNLNPLFVTLLAAIFLGEIFTPIKYLAVFLLLLGSMLIVYEKSSSLKPTKTFWLVVLSVFLIAITQIMTKLLVPHLDYWSIFGWARVGSFLTIIPFFFLYAKDFAVLMKKNGGKTVALMTISETLNLVAVLLLTIATASGFVTFVSSIALTQPLFVILLASLISIYYPKILSEGIDKSSIALKVVAVLIMIAGALLIV